MEYLSIFNQLDQKYSQKIEDLQRQQEEWIEKKKYLLEAKQKVHCFLSDAYEIKQVLDFQPELITSIQGELNKIFQGEIQSENLSENYVKSDNKTSKSLADDLSDLDPQMIIDTDEENSVTIYKFVDNEGKDTSY